MDTPKRALDLPIQKIAEYTSKPLKLTSAVQEIAGLCLMDALSCAIKALEFKEAVQILGPYYTGDSSTYGARIPGTHFQVSPDLGAFQIGALIRWLDYNDTFLAKEWGHPSDNLGGILAIADHLSQTGKELRIKDVLEALVKAYEIQGMLALENCFNEKGFDHVILVKVATAAVTAHLMGGNFDQIASAVSNAIADTGPLRCYRHFPNTGPRKSWAAGDASSRGLFFATMAIRGEPGIHMVISAERFGLKDVILPLQLTGTLSTYVIENILFKVRYPAEFHAQTAVECAIRLHNKVKDRLDHIESIHIETQGPGSRIIDKKGPLTSYADRDHCIQYMVAVPLIKGTLAAEDYSDENARDPRIDKLRNLMTVSENKRFSDEYLESDKRSIANSVEIRFKEGTHIKEELDYPLGHKKRRQEALPHLMKKIESNLKGHLGSVKTEKLLAFFADKPQFYEEPVNRFMERLTILSESV